MMPDPEVHQKAKEKIESTQKQMANCSPSLAFLPDDEFVELLWENGEIVMKGQSNRAKKCSLASFFSSDAPNVEEKDEGDAVIPKIGRYSNLSAMMNDFSPPGLIQDDEMVPWLNYSVHDSLQGDYFAEFFTELTGTDLNSPSGQSDAVVTDNTNNSQVGIDGNVVSSHSSRSQEHRNPSEVVVGVSEPTRIGSLESSSAKQGQTSVSNLRSRVSEFITNNDSIKRESVPSCLIQSPVSATNTETQKNDLSSTRAQEHRENRVLMNFSHFLRPAGLVKANMQDISTASASCSSADGLKRNEEVSVSGSNLIEPSLVVSRNGSKGLVGFQNLPASVSAKLDSKSFHEPSRELFSVENSEATCQEDASRNNDDDDNNMSSRDDALHQSLSFAASVAAQKSESEKVLEPVLASSSMCSGNSAGGVSNEPRHAMKRKAGESEELEYQSEDVEDESTVVKKPTNSSKRSRTAEVHNLSERRRRDRINEKMRALQELIPNCNKVDKASMLDEAIEYIKTLQLQMQMMSMGSRFCMPPMMLPAGIQHIGTPAMPRFAPLGVGMGMGMGATFGMGMPEVNFPTHCHMVPVPSIHGAQFPCPSVPGPSNLNGMQASNLHMFGVSGQSLPFVHPHPSFIPFPGGFCSKEPPAPNVVSGSAAPVSNHDSSLPSSSKSQTQNINLQTMHNTNADGSQIQITEETKECSEPGDLVQTSNPTSPVCGSRVMNTVSKNGVTSSGSD